MLASSTAKQVILCRRKNEKVFKMSKGEKCTCKACKNTVFHCQICKFVEFLLPSSSWLLELPNVIERMRLKHFSLQCMLNNLENIPQKIIKRFTFHITNKSSFQSFHTPKRFATIAVYCNNTVVKFCRRACYNCY